MTGTVKTKLPFARAYDFIMADKRLIPAEKLVVIEVCRYWPKPCYESATTIAYKCGLDERYVRNLIKGLCQGKARRKASGKPERRAYLKRAYVHAERAAKASTCRVIVPLCLPSEEGARIGAPDPTEAQESARISAPGAPIDPGGRAYRPTPSAPIGPPNRNENRNRNRKKEERDASPLPAGGQASASRYTSLRAVSQGETDEERARKRAEVEKELETIGDRLTAK